MFFFIDCSQKFSAPECKPSTQSIGNVALYIGVAVGVCLLIIFFIIVVVFVVRKQKSTGIDQHNSYIQPISEFDITNLSTIENDSCHPLPTEEHSYHSIPNSHFDNTQEKCLYF